MNCSNIKFISLFSAILLLNNSLIAKSNNIEEAPLNITFNKIDKNINIKFLYKDGNFYAPIVDLFKLFKIEYIFLKNDNKMIGFYPYSENKYTIDFNTLIYNIRGKKGTLYKDDFFIKNKKYYFKADTLNKLFNLHMIINFSELSLTFSNEEELPIVRNYLHEEKLKKKLLKKDKKIKYNYFLKEKKTYFRAGRIGLESLFSNNIPLGLNKNNPNFLKNAYSQNIYGGFELGKGDFLFNLTGNEKKLINLDTSNFTLSYIKPENKNFKKINIGDISSGGLYGKQYKGVFISNNYRNFTGEFNNIFIEKYTFPNSYIEVYRNNINIINIKSNSKGFYKVNIPIYYGSNQIELRIYGPHGERDTVRYLYNIKNGLLKKGEFIYNASVGNTSKIDSSVPNHNYVAANIKYGYNDKLAIKSGVLFSDEDSYTKNKFGKTKNVNSNSFYTGIDTNIKGNYNVSSLYKYEDYLNTNINYLSNNFYINNYYNHTFIEKEQDIFGTSYNVQLDEDNLRFSYRRKMENKDFGKDGINEYSTTLMTRFTNRFFSNLKAIYIDYDNPIQSNDTLINYRFTTSLFKRWMPRFLIGTNFTISGDYSLNYGAKDINLKIEKNINQKTRYTLFYNKIFNKNFQDKNSLKLQVTQDFDKFYAILNLSYNENNSFSSQVGFGVNIGYNDRLSQIYLSSWKNLGKGEVVVVPYSDDNYDSKYNGKDKILEEAAFMVNGGTHMLTHEQNIYHSPNVISYENNTVKGNEFTDGDSLYIPKYQYAGFKPRPNLFSTLYYPYIKTTYIQAVINDKTYNKILPGIIVDLENLKTKKVTQVISDLDGEVYFGNVIPGDYILTLNAEQLGDLRFRAKKRKIFIHKKDLIKLSHKVYNFDIYKK